MIVRRSRTSELLVIDPAPAPGHALARAPQHAWPLHEGSKTVLVAQGPRQAPAIEQLRSAFQSAHVGASSDTSQASGVGTAMMATLGVMLFLGLFAAGDAASGRD